MSEQPYYSSPDSATLYGVVIEGTDKGIAFFWSRDDAEVFAREGFFAPYKPGFQHAEVHKFTFDKFKPMQEKT